MSKLQPVIRRVFLGLAALCVSTSANALALEDGTFLFDDETPVPAVVTALEDCGADEKPFATRQPFAGGFLFAIQCPGNNENFMQALIFAEAEDGTGAYPLQFYGPDDIRDDFADVVSNVRVYADKNEIGEIFVDREADERADPNVGRTEGRWRLRRSTAKAEARLLAGDSGVRRQHRLESHPRRRRRPGSLDKS